MLPKPAPHSLTPSRPSLEEVAPVAHAPLSDLQSSGASETFSFDDAVKLCRHTALRLGREDFSHRTEAWVSCLSQELRSLWERTATTLSTIESSERHRSSSALRQMVSEGFVDGVLRGLKEYTEHLGYEIGLCQGRKLNQERIDALRGTLREYLSAHRAAYPSLWSSYPDLERQVAAGIAAAVDRGIEARHDAEKSAIQISSALRRFWPQFEKVFAAISQPASQRALIEEAFRQRYGTSILQDVRDVCARPGIGLMYKAERILARTEHIFAGESCAAKADAVALHLSSVFRPSFDSFAQTLRLFSVEEIPAIERAFNESYQTRYGLFCNLGNQFSGGRKEIVDSLLQGNRLQALVVEAHTLLRSGAREHAKLSSLLEQLPRSELEKLCQKYQERYERELSLDILQSVSRTPLRNRMLHWIAGEDSLHMSACLRCALWKVDQTSVAEYFLDTTPSERQSIVENYERHYQTKFFQDVERNLRKRERYLVSSVLASGVLLDEEAIFQCVDGAGTDVGGLKTVLRHKRSSEVADLAKRFADLMDSRTGRREDLAERLLAETSGDDRLDIQQLLCGWPSTARGWMARVSATHRHERSGLFRQVDIITREGPIMDRDVAALWEYFDSRTDKRALSPQEEQRIEHLARIALRDCGAFRRTKNALAEVASKWAGALGTLGALLGTAKLGFPLHGNLTIVLPTIVLVSTTCRYATKSFLKGAGYSLEEKMVDFLSGGVMDAAGPSLAHAPLPMRPLRQLFNYGAKLTGRFGIQRIQGLLHATRVASLSRSAQDIQVAFHLTEAPEAEFDPLQSNGPGNEGIVGGVSERLVKDSPVMADLLGRTHSQ